MKSLTSIRKRIDAMKAVVSLCDHCRVIQIVIDGVPNAPRKPCLRPGRCVGNGSEVTLIEVAGCEDGRDEVE